MAMADCLRLPSPKTAKPLFGNQSVGVKSSRSGILTTPNVAPKVTEQEAIRTFTVKGVTFRMKLVKAGTFMMGATPEMEDGADSDEFPVHEVTLTKDYYMCETQVTQALWHAVMWENPSRFTGNDQRPVERVSWNDCQNFIAKLNRIMGEHFRLPTEAEWEFAARGGNESKGCRYAGSNDLDEVAWYDGNSNSQTHQVATKQPNELGLYDMSGNVWEWCADWYDEDYYQTSPEVDPQGPDLGPHRVLRGGSWCSYARNCRLSGRLWSNPELGDDNFGLRLSL